MSFENIRFFLLMICFHRDLWKDVIGGDEEKRLLASFCPEGYRYRLGESVWRFFVAAGVAVKSTLHDGSRSSKKAKKPAIILQEMLMNYGRDGHKN